MPTSRRRAIKQVVAGTAGVGAVWAAPRVDGLSLRPDYAAAQSGPPGDTPSDSPGGGLDLTISGATDGGAVSTSSSPTDPGIDFARLRGAVNNVGFNVRFDGRARGSMIPGSCSISGVDITGNAVFGSLSGGQPITTIPASSNFQVNGNLISAGDFVARLHVVCT